MTEAEALEILKMHNIHRGFWDTERLFLRAGDEVLHGEEIGQISNGYVYLADYIPSVIGKTYLSVSDTAVSLSNPDAPAVLNRMLDRLKDSAERYDEETRRKRVSDIHQYFLKRNMKIKILPPDVDIPDPPDEGTLYLR
jgi:hypothetical protein